MTFGDFPTLATKEDKPIKEKMNFGNFPAYPAVNQNYAQPAFMATKGTGFKKEKTKLKRKRLPPAKYPRALKPLTTMHLKSLHLTFIELTEDFHRTSFILRDISKIKTLQSLTL